MRRAGARAGFAFAALFSLWDGDGERDALSWWGFGAVSLTLLVLGIIVLRQERAALRRLLRSWNALPVGVFSALCLVSVAWSAYPIETLAGWGIQVATGLVGIAVLVSMPRRRLVALFALVLHVHLALAIVFELVVALSPAHMLLPFFTDYGSNVPGAYYWSQGLILSGGRIQGIVGNANLTCFNAIVALILLGVLIRVGAVRRWIWIPALLLDLVVLGLTRSATASIAGGLALVAALIVVGWRHSGRAGRAGLATAGTAAVAVIALGSSRLFEPVTAILGRGDDLTGRLEIWRLVGQLVEQRPVLGWGWISYWAPWIEPFRSYVIRGGVQYLQAHNAYLDVQLQLGVPGLVALVVLVGSVVYRALRLALVPRPYTVLPLLLLVALLTQALAESRLLLEGNWALLVMLSVAVPAVARTVASADAPEHGGTRMVTAQ